MGAISVKTSRKVSSRRVVLLLALLCFSLPACNEHEQHAEEHAEGHQQIVVTTPRVQDIILTQQYVCQIHSQRHIKVCALQSGYLMPISVKEGQAVTEKEPMFKILPTLYEAKLATEKAEANLAALDLQYTESLANQNPPVVSPKEVAMYQAKLKKAEAKVKLAEAELFFTEVRAPFDGIIDRLHEMQGSLVKEGDVLTTLSDNTLMWVYFNVPEANYIEYMASSSQDKAAQRIELMLANGKTFKHDGKVINGKIAAIEAKFNNETGTVPFRADFQNPDGLLRHGMTGNVLIHKPVHNALVIPQRATFEILDKRYVYVVDKNEVAHQREIIVQHEQPDIFIIQKGLTAEDRIVFEGVRQVHDGAKVEFEFRSPDRILTNQTFYAE